MTNLVYSLYTNQFILLYILRVRIQPVHLVAAIITPNPKGSEIKGPRQKAESKRPESNGPIHLKHPSKKGPI